MPNRRQLRGHHRHPHHELNHGNGRAAVNTHWACCIPHRIQQASLFTSFIVSGLWWSSEWPKPFLVMGSCRLTVLLRRSVPSVVQGPLASVLPECREKGGNPVPPRICVLTRPLGFRDLSSDVCSPGMGHHTSRSNTLWYFLLCVVSFLQKGVSKPCVVLQKKKKKSLNSLYLDFNFRWTIEEGFKSVLNMWYFPLTSKFWVTALSTGWFVNSFSCCLVLWISEWTYSCWTRNCGRGSWLWALRHTSLF